MTARQQDILAWAIGTFGPIAISPDERVLRFAEEAIELAHAHGLNRIALEALVIRVYSRPRGDLAQEIGQCIVTLEMLAESIGVSADREADAEFERIKGLPKEHHVRRHNAKIVAGITTGAAS